MRSCPHLETHQDLLIGQYVCYVKNVRLHHFSVLHYQNVATAGMADSFLKASHVTRTRHAHQVTSSALSILMRKAYDTYTCEEIEPLAFDKWCLKQAETSPQFQYWLIIIRLELLVLVYVRSIREGNFALYVAALEAMAPWFFALDQTHYSRWIPVHIRDMVTLQDRLPDVARQFEQGDFVVHKTNRPFSALAIDHAHEQNNAVVKGDGGAVGLLQNPRALLRWMVAGPELARVVHGFETVALESSTSKNNLKHHEHTLSAQVSFAKEVTTLIQVIDDMGNPFTDESGDLLVLDSRDIVDSEIADNVRSIENLGQQQYEQYVKERMLERTTPIMDPIKRNNIPLFSRPPPKVSSKATHLSSLKSDCALFSRLYIASQMCEGDLENFFRPENHAYPPSLSQLGKLRFGTKADLTECLEKLCKPSGEAPVADVIILDGAAIVNMLRPVGTKTFQEYATLVFLPYIKAQLRNVSRVDIVWDMYIQGSLKSTAREKRGKGIRRHVTAANTIPGNWQEFLRLDNNKTELFEFLAHQVLPSPITMLNIILNICK
uniref:uncharacterized protein n=1 Tax=Myxine glutinosa TaxID=7769 RepID=UPI00358FF46D